MKVNILARPDHSIALYKGLKKIDQVNPHLYTFYAARKGSAINKLLPKRKSVPSDVNTLDLFTLISYSLRKLIQPMGLNFRVMEITLLKLFLSKKILTDCDILHYWPFYCSDFIRDIKSGNSLKTVAEYYEAEPSFVNNLYKEEYKKYNIHGGNNVNTLINQNESFEYEENFIVGSSYTKETYLKVFPNSNIHVCSYGSAEIELSKNIENKINNFKSSRKYSLVYVGQVSLEKGVHYLIDALSSLNVSLDLIGPIRHGQEEIFENIISKNSHKVNFLGPKTNLEVMSILKNYSLFVLPSLSDNYSIAVSEALSQGVPVIITKNCGNRDDIIKHGLGYVVEAGSSSELKNAITQFHEEFDFDKFFMGLKAFFNPSQESYSFKVNNIYKQIINN